MSEPPSLLVRYQCDKGREDGFDYVRVWHRSEAWRKRLQSLVLLHSFNIINIHLYPSTFNSKVKNWKDQKTDYFLIIFLLREG
jgi:hypothetical protein